MWPPSSGSSGKVEDREQAEMKASPQVQADSALVDHLARRVDDADRARDLLATLTGDDAAQRGSDHSITRQLSAAGSVDSRAARGAVHDVGRSRTPSARRSSVGFAPARHHDSVAASHRRLDARPCLAESLRRLVEVVGTDAVDGDDDVAWLQPCGLRRRVGIDPVDPARSLRQDAHHVDDRDEQDREVEFVPGQGRPPPFSTSSGASTHPRRGVLLARSVPARPWRRRRDRHRARRARAPAAEPAPPSSRPRRRAS